MCNLRISEDENAENEVVFQAFPHLRSRCRITSQATPDYNSVAWTLNINDQVWWPDAMHISYWPPGIPRRETLDAFEAMFHLLEYINCNNNSNYESDYEKIAIYVRQGIPTHVTRQKSNGTWTSKIKEYNDIEHDTLDALIIDNPSALQQEQNRNDFGCVSLLLKVRRNQAQDI